MNLQPIIQKLDRADFERMLAGCRIVYPASGLRRSGLRRAEGSGREIGAWDRREGSDRQIGVADK